MRDDAMIDYCCYCNNGRCRVSVVRSVEYGAIDYISSVVTLTTLV